MDSVLNKAVQQSDIAFTKFITANDVGTTGSHQTGFHVHKNAWRLFFGVPGTKGTNKDKSVTIKWQDDFETQSRFVYYGTGTRNEYRLTRFGRGFPYLRDESLGDLLVFAKKSEDYFEASVLRTDEEIDGFLAALNISPTDINGIVPKPFEQTAEDRLSQCFSAFIRSLSVDFPTTAELAKNARNCCNSAYNIEPEHVRENPDKWILSWLDTEFQLFKSLENDRYSQRIKTPFTTVEDLVETANTILNRRKSRAGKSLEHHLSEIFSTFELSFAAQAATEGYKRPDFLFPNADAYLNPRFNEEKLLTLASKTTCKDRWRQVLNEADRIKTKHLFTLQQGISKNQLEEMYRYGVRLVVPEPYLRSFPEEFRERILTLDKFVRLVAATQQQ